MRLFVAVAPPGDVLDVLEGFPRRDTASLRWTTRAQWHVTLRFLGAVTGDHEVVEALRGVPEALAAAGVVDVRATLGPASAWFPGRLVLQVPVGGLDAVADVVRTLTAPWGVERGPRAFAGHLTLARARGHTSGPATLAGVPLTAAWSVRELTLFSSTPTPHGARYDRVASIALGL